MANAQRLGRRQFLVATSAAVAAPYFVPMRAFGANDRITTGHIGLGGQGNGNLGALMKHAVAVCDVDKNRLAAAAKKVEAANGSCEAFDDYRKLLERKDIDAVVISTPDHWHALATIHACQAGKDVYCEKPLSLTVAEGRQMVEAARKNNRIVQTGSQQRSGGNFRKVCELVRSGRLGKLQTVLVGLPGANFGRPAVPDSDPPAELNYDFWLGPAPQRPYNAKRVHYNFRFFWDYSGGQMTNWGAHHIDIAHWGMGMDNSGPLSVAGTAEFDAKKEFEVTTKCRLEYKYPGDVTMIVAQNDKTVPGGTTFIGEKGQIHVDRGGQSSNPPELLTEPLSADAVKLYDSPGHHRDFLDCIKSRKLPVCDVEIGHRSATACHLGNLVARLGRKIEWDAEKEQIKGDEEAAGMLSRPYRAPYTV